MNEAITQALSIGSVIGGKTAKNEAWEPHLVALTKLSIEISSQVSTSPGINVVFQIPGPFLVPEFSGVIAGAYSRKESVLAVIAALPESPPTDAYRHLTALVGAALDVAIATCVKRRIPHDLHSLVEAVSAI